MAVNITNFGVISYKDNHREYNIHTAGNNIADIIRQCEAEDIQAEEVKPQQPKNKDDKNARAILAVHQANLCDAAEWAVVVKIMQEQGAMPKANYRNAAEYINDICGTIVTSPESLARSIIFTKVAGTYPNWQIKEEEQSRRTPQKLRKFLQIAQVFINAQNA